MYSAKKFGLTDFVHYGESEDKSASQVYPLLEIALNLEISFS